MMNKILKRIQNPKILTAVISGVLMILVNLGAIDMTVSDKAMDIFNLVLGMGVAMGIFANPESHVEVGE